MQSVTIAEMNEQSNQDVTHACNNLRVHCILLAVFLAIVSPGLMLPGTPLVLELAYVYTCLHSPLPPKSVHVHLLGPPALEPALSVQESGHREQPASRNVGVKRVWRQEEVWQAAGSHRQRQAQRCVESGLPAV